MTLLARFLYWFLFLGILGIFLSDDSSQNVVSQLLENFLLIVGAILTIVLFIPKGPRWIGLIVFHQKFLEAIGNTKKEYQGGVEKKDKQGCNIFWQ